MKPNRKCLLLFLEVKSCMYWKILRIKAIQVVGGIKVAEKAGFLCLYAVPIRHMWRKSCFLYENLPVWPPGVKFSELQGS